MGVRPDIASSAHIARVLKGGYMTLIIDVEEMTWPLKGDMGCAASPQRVKRDPFWNCDGQISCADTGGLSYAG